MATLSKQIAQAREKLAYWSAQKASATQRRWLKYWGDKLYALLNVSASAPPPTPIDNTPPGDVTGTPTASYSAGAVTLAWTAAIPASGLSISGYVIERRMDAGAWISFGSHLSNSTPSDTDSSATPGHTWDYRFKARGSNGIDSTNWSATASVTISGSPGADTHAPPAPGISAAENITSSTFELPISFVEDQTIINEEKTESQICKVSDQSGLLGTYYYPRTKVAKRVVTIGTYGPTNLVPPLAVDTGSKLTAGGYLIYGTADAFSAPMTQVQGSHKLTVVFDGRVDGDKAVVHMRQDLTPNAKMVQATVWYDGVVPRVNIEARLEDGAEAVQLEGVVAAFPITLELDYVQERGRASMRYKSDGGPWTSTDNLGAPLQFDVAFSRYYEIGHAVCNQFAAGPSAIAEYNYSGYSLVPNTSFIHYGVGQTAGSTRNMSVTVEDGATPPNVSPAATRDVTLLGAVVTPSSYDKFAQPAFSDQNYADRGYHTVFRRTQMAQVTDVYLTVYPGWVDNNGQPIINTITTLKAMKPGINVYCYLAQDSIMATPAWASVLAHADAGPRNWRAYLNGTSGAQDIDPGYPLETPMNHTNFCPIDNEVGSPTYGKRWNRGVVALVVQQLMALGFDGIFIDNVFTHAHFQADWNRDGTTEYQAGYNPGATGDAAYWQSVIRQGFVETIQEMRAVFPGIKIATNSAYWTDLAQNIDEYVGQVDQPWRENMLGPSYSPEVWGGWYYMMQEWRKLSVAAKTVGGAAFQCASTDQAILRYGLASCRLEDGVFSWSDSELYNLAGSFPESTIELGAPTGPTLGTGNGRNIPITLGSAWQNNVYRRDHEKGIVLVCPKGAGSRLITLERTFYKHDGTPMLSTTIPERDGLILRANP